MLKTALFIALAFFLTTFITACLNTQPKEFRQGMIYLETQQYQKADKEFQQLLSHSPYSRQAIEAASKAALVHFDDTKQYLKSILYYKHLVQFSKNKQQQKKSQQQIAYIYFYKVLNYRQAIKSYNELLIFDNTDLEVFEAQYNIARSYFYLNRFFQAQVEAQKLRQQKLSKKESFDAELLLAQILFGGQKLNKAMDVYRQLALKHPKKSIQEKVHLNIAVCLEEQKKFAEAIEELEKMKPFYKDTKFIELRIKKLQLHAASRPKTRRAI